MQAGMRVHVVHASPENIENTHKHVYSDIRIYAQLLNSSIRE